MAALRARVDQLAAEDAANAQPRRIPLRLDGGFGDAEQVAWLYEQGYDFVARPTTGGWARHRASEEGLRLEQVSKIGFLAESQTTTLGTCRYPPRLFAARQWRGEGRPERWSALVANPVDAARVLGVLALEPDLYLLGPAGAFLTTTLSPAGTAGALIAALLLWAVTPVCAAVIKFSIRRRGHSYVGHQDSAAVVGHHAGHGDRVHVERGVAGVQG